MFFACGNLKNRWRGLPECADKYVGGCASAPQAGGGRTSHSTQPSNPRGVPGVQLSRESAPARVDRTSVKQMDA